MTALRINIRTFPNFASVELFGTFAQNCLKAAPNRTEAAVFSVVQDKATITAAATKLGSLLMRDAALVRRKLQAPHLPQGEQAI